MVCFSIYLEKIRCRFCAATVINTQWDQQDCKGRESLLLYYLLALRNSAAMCSMSPGRSRPTTWHYGSPGLIVSSAVSYKLDTVLLVLPKLPDLSSWWSSLSQGCPFITGKIVAAQSCWHISPLKHDHREPRLTSVFWPTSMSPCQNNRLLARSNWQLSENLHALGEIVQRLNHLGSHWLKRSHHLLADWLVSNYIQLVLWTMLIDNCL